MTRLKAPRCLVFPCCLIVSVVPVSGQQLGMALWGQGYTRTLYLEATSHALTTGVFNPNAVGAADRYGPAIDWHTSFGNTVGERASCETVDRYVAAGLLPGLGAGFHCTQFDLSDAKLLTRSGQRAAFDDMAEALRSQPSPAGPPAPPVCPAGKSCLALGEGCPPVLPCPNLPAPPACPSCPTCPAVVACPPTPPAIVCPALAGVPGDIVPLLKEIASYNVMGPGRKAKVVRVLNWAMGQEACKAVRP
jgi:hypothetical protein